MTSPRWRKVLRDIAHQKMRTLLVVLAIAVGIAAFGSVYITNDILLVNMDYAYRISKPSTIQLYLSGFDETLLSWVARQPGVIATDGKADHTVTLKLPTGRDVRLSLTAVPDYETIALNLLVPQRGSWPPGDNELVLERESLRAGPFVPGEPVTVVAAADRTMQLTYAGDVYDNSAIPYMFTQQMTGFISWKTLATLGYPKQYTRVEVATDPQTIRSLPDAEKLAFTLTEALKDRGVSVNGTRVDRPNEHWAVNNSKAFTAILSVIGIFSLVLSGFLVVNTITALLSQQRKHIGIMKAIGGRNTQLLAVYLAMVGAYGALALVVAIPVSYLIGRFFVDMVMNFLNLTVYTFYIPRNVLLLEAAAALLVPAGAGFLPIWQGIRGSVREAISDVRPVKQTGAMELVLARIKGMKRQMRLSLRNVFRKKGRLILTMGTLVVAGGVFMAVINSRGAMFAEMERILSMFQFEVSVATAGSYDAGSVVSRLSGIPSVTAVEARTGAGARRVKEDGTKGDQFRLSGLPPDTVFSDPILLSGRWLDSSDTDAVVLSSGYANDNPDLAPGDSVTVEVNDDTYNLEIVGIIAMAGDQKLGFLPFDTVASMRDEPGLASSFLLKTDPPDAVTQDTVANEAEERLKRARVTVAAKQTKHEIFSSASGQFDFMIFFLLAMAVMIAVVGGLGLAGTMSLNVIERTREIGIMRSIGANNRAILSLVLTEGIFIGLLSWVFAIPLSFLLTYGFGYAIGNAFFSRTLVFVVEPVGIILWLGIILGISVVASAIPSHNASKMSINQTLAYE